MGQEYSLAGHNTYEEDPGYIPEESYVLNDQGQFEAKPVSESLVEQEDDSPTLSLQATSEDDISHLVLNFGESSTSSYQWAPSLPQSSCAPFFKAVEGWENELLGSQLLTPFHKRNYDYSEVETVVKKELQKYGLDSSGLLSVSSGKTLVRDKAHTMLRQMRMGTTLLSP